jgi:DNA-binding HxlR family transcriptional regulator
MLRRDYANQNCSIASTLELIGERWTILILRDLFLGVHRFDEIQRDLGIARNILQRRLGRLVDAGLVKRVRYQERPERFEYRLTRKGVDLWPVVIALQKWGDRHLFEDAPPVVIVHKGCGAEIDDRRRCTACGIDVEAWEVEPKLGPGAHESQREPGAPVTVG